MISFVIPSYNAACWLAQAVKSCLDQSYKDIEVLVVDDCSTDSTPDYLAWQIKHDSRVRFLRNEVNLGRSVSRNKGNAAALGEVICVLDADDLALPHRAKITADKFSKGCEYLYGSAVAINEIGQRVNDLPANTFNKEKAIEALANGIVHSTVAYTKKFAERFPHPDGEAAKLGLDDWTQQLEAVFAGVTLDFVPNVLAAYRLLDSGISNIRDNAAVKDFKLKFLEGLKTPV